MTISTHGLPSLRRSLSCSWLTGPRAVMTWFLIAQPVTFLLWSWALHSVLPAVQTVFAAQAYVLNLSSFSASFSLLVILFFPLAVIDLAGGFLFGVWVGLPLALFTKTLGSVLCFLLSRHTCGDYLRRTLVDHYEWLGALSLMMREREFKTMALLRFSAIPAAIKNYGCGGLGVSVRIFAMATALALSLESFVLVPVGAKIDSLQGMFARKQTTQERLALFLGIFLLAALVLAIKRTVRVQVERIQRSSDEMVAMVEGEETEQGALNSIHGGRVGSIEEAAASRDSLVGREPDEVDLSLGGVIENTRMMGSVMY